MAQLDACWFGRTPYGRALKIMSMVKDRVAQTGEEVLLLMEHPPVVTLGRNADRGNLLLSPEEYAQRGVEVVQIGRGGDVTFHGPGQLVGYPIAPVGRLVLRHVDTMFAVLKELLFMLGVEAHYNPEYPGLWVGKAKIAAVGVEIQEGIALHGFSLNVEPLTKGFDTIVPCGLPHTRVVSLAELVPAPPVGQLAQEFAWRYAAQKRLLLNLLTPTALCEKHNLSF